MKKQQPASFWFRAIAIELVAAGGILALVGGGKPSSSDDLPPLAPPTISVVPSNSGLRTEAISPWTDATALLPAPPALVDVPPPMLSSWRTSSGQRRLGPPLINPSRR